MSPLDFSGSQSAADAVMGKATKMFDEYSFDENRPQGRPAPQTVPSMAALSASQRMEAQSIGFAGALPPNLHIAKEASQHRIIVYLKAQGHTNREVAKATGFSEAWVSQIVRQAWFRERLALELREAGLDPVKQFLKGEVMPSFQVIADVRDDKSAPPAARIAAADKILDRVFGKPTVTVHSEHTVNAGNAKQTADQLENEIRAIDEQLKARGQSIS